MTRFTCPVCGYPGLTERPRAADGGSSYEICYSCNFEFGVTDDDRGYTYEEWRTGWIKRGMPWGGQGLDHPPKGWDPESQLQSLLDT